MRHYLYTNQGHTLLISGVEALLAAVNEKLSVRLELTVFYYYVRRTPWLSLSIASSTSNERLKC